MDVDSIINRVGELASGDDAPAGDYKTTILSHVNAAKDELFTRVAEVSRDFRNATNTYTTDANGQITLSAAPFKVLSVFDTTNDNKLERSSFSDLEEKDVDLDDTGTPYYFVWDGSTTISAHPIKQSVNLRVRTIEDAADLAAGGAESTIPFPRAFHWALVYGALVHLHLYERDALVASEMANAKRLYEQWKGQLIQYYITSSGKNRRVE
jgi:hypothetical protein